MSKGIKRVEDAQRNKIGQEALDGMRINPAKTLDNVNWIKEKCMASLKEAQQAQVKW